VGCSSQSKWPHFTLCCYDVERLGSHVLQHHLAIDISVFCDYLERLCSFISMQSRSTLGVPHNVMLPRSWLLSSLHRQVESLPQLHYYSLLLPLVRNIGKLLEAVQLPDTYRGEHIRLLQAYSSSVLTSGCSPDWLSYAGRPLDNTRGFLIRQMFIARICKVLVLSMPNPTHGIHVSDSIISASQYKRRHSERRIRLSEVLAETGVQFLPPLLRSVSFMASINRHSLVHASVDTSRHLALHISQRWPGSPLATSLSTR
jgi:hypothetical protein